MGNDPVQIKVEWKEVDPCENIRVQASWLIDWLIDNLLKVGLVSFESMATTAQLDAAASVLVLSMTLVFSLILSVSK